MIPFVIGVVIGVLLTIAFLAVVRMKEEERDQK